MEEDPYRTPALACPGCQASPLRRFLHRLVCDACGGMLIRLTDLQSEVADVASHEIEVVAEGRTALPCPRCQEPLQSCRLAIGTVTLDRGVLHCQRDGVWLPGGGLEKLFESLGRRYGSGAGGGGGFYGGVGSLWKPLSRRSPPTVRAPGFQSAHRDQRLECPVCSHVALRLRGELWPCERCGGVFVENAVLEALVAEMSKAPWTMPPVAGAPGSRLCPVCREVLAVEPLGSVEIDRCAEHGVWFDPDELTTALHEVGDPPSHGVADWLRRLFFYPSA